MFIPMSIVSPTPNKNNPNAGRIFDYGVVEEIYSKDYTAKIRLANGQILARCRILSWEWAAPSVAGNKFKRSGRRSLPPVNSRVVVLKPFYSYDDAIVIGSDFIYDANYTKDDFASSGDSDKAEEDLHITPGGWEITESRKDGVITIVRGELKLTMKDDGSGGVSLEDGNKNKIELSSKGIKITDKNSNVVEMGSTSIKLNNNLKVLQ